MLNDRSTYGIWLGRSREMSELEAALDDLARGRGSLFLFVGEPGIGKTRLADEVGRAAAGRGAAVHWGRAWEAGGAPSYWPFVQILRSVARGVDVERILPSLGPHGAVLAAWMPEIHARFPVRMEEPAEPTRDRFQLFDAVATFLHAAAAGNPQVLILDDLHAADPSSLSLLQFLVRDLRRGPLFLVGTYRDAEARISRETGAALAQVAREGNVLPLRRLYRAEVAEYLALADGTAPAADRVEAIYRQTEGNPLFLRELLRLHTNTGRHPEGIRDVVRARLALLSPPARSTLEAASVLGREFELGTLERMVECSEADLASTLAPAVDASIVERLEPAGRLRFAHVLLREGLYSDLPGQRRAALHASAARALAPCGGSPPLAELAHHLLQAIPAVSLGNAADAALRGAEHAMDLLAFEDASDLLGRAARLLEGAPGEERRLFEVWLGLGLARIQGADVERGRAVCLRAVDLARKVGDGDLFARAVLGCAYEYAPGARNAHLIALLEEALAMLPPGDGSLRARCSAQLAAERQPEPDTRGPMVLARAAVAMARRLGDKDTLRFTLATAGLALMVYADPEECIALNQETLRLAQAARDRRLAVRAHLLLSGGFWEQGDLEHAQAHVRAYESLAREFSHGAFRWPVVAIRAAIALSEGRFDEAERGFRESGELAQKDDTLGTSRAALPVGIACAEERYENIAEVEVHTREAFGSVSHDLGGCIAELLVARLYGRARDREKAARHLVRLRAHPVFPQIEEPAWLALLAEVCQLLGDVALARGLYGSLEPRADRFLNLGHLGPWCEPPYSRQLGLLALTLGNNDDAVRHLGDAEARTTALGMRAHLARLRLELAEALLARSSPGDPERARSLLEDARALARELNQQALMQFIDQHLSDLRGRQVSSPGAQAGSADASPAAAPPRASVELLREGDYWTVAYGSRTVRLRDSRGLDVLQRLLTSPGQEFHVLQLVSSGEDDSRPGDAGAVLDPEAIQGYRKRLLELREELEEAEQFADRGRTDRAKGEIDFLTQELARAVGLGGRERRVGNAAERARTTVQKRLREAIRRIEDELPELGGRLEQAVRTGTFCGYFPSGRAPRRASRARRGAHRRRRRARGRRRVGSHTAAPDSVG
jgi:hypothetical protein